MQRWAITKSAKVHRRFVLLANDDRDDNLNGNDNDNDNDDINDSDCVCDDIKWRLRATDDLERGAIMMLPLVLSQHRLIL